MKLRSWLCASPLKKKLVEKCETYSADVIHFDLEDAVPPGKKAIARAGLKAAFPPQHPLPVAVRINRLATLEGLRDVLFLTEFRLLPTIIILPKAQLARDVSLVSAIFPDSPIFAVIETLDSYFELRQLSVAPAGLAGIIFGAADFAVEMALDPLRAAQQLRPIKAEICLNARRLGLRAIDSPCFFPHQQTLLQSEIVQARKQGFSGKIAIHPAQIGPINQGFTTNETCRARARRVMSMLDKVPGITTDAQAMLGPPHLRYARHILAQK